MANLVLGIGTSHSPQLSMMPEAWSSRAGSNDRSNTRLVGTDGIMSNYEDLLARADVERIANEITPEKMEERHERNQRGIEWVQKQIYDADLDALVMVGDDQQEYLRNDNMPGFCVYWGEEVKVRGQGEEYTASTGHQPLLHYFKEDRVVPTHASLGRHIIESLVEADFDVACSQFLDYEKGGRSRGGIGHAFGFVYHRLLTDGLVATVPIMVNTYYPPNQPTPKRSFEFGRRLREAIEAWQGDARIGVLASGGLSHFVVDEELDQMALEGMQEKSIDKLMQLPRERLLSGNSEVRNWIVATGATEHLSMELFDYVPCYRSPAGTGCAMAFAKWS